MPRAFQALRPVVRCHRFGEQLYMLTSRLGFPTVILPRRHVCSRPGCREVTRTRSHVPWCHREFLRWHLPMAHVPALRVTRGVGTKSSIRRLSFTAGLTYSHPAAQPLKRMHSHATVVPSSHLAQELPQGRALRHLCDGEPGAQSSVPGTLAWPGNIWCPPAGAVVEGLF